MDALPVNVTDLAVIAVVVISGLLAFVRGFVHEILAVGAWIGAAIATVFFLPAALPHARDLISIQIAADIAAGAAIFILVLIVLSIFTHWLARRVRESGLGALDRSLGLLFGFLRGALLACLAWLALVALLPRDQHPPWIREARVLPLIEQGSTMLLAVVPESLLPDVLLEPAPEAERSIDRITQPRIGESGSGTKESLPGGAGGYKDAERKELQRLIDSSQQGRTGGSGQ